MDDKFQLEITAACQKFLGPLALQFIHRAPTLNLGGKLSKLERRVLAAQLAGIAGEKDRETVNALLLAAVVVTNAEPACSGAWGGIVELCRTLNSDEGRAALEGMAKEIDRIVGEMAKDRERMFREYAKVGTPCRHHVPTGAIDVSRPAAK